MKMHHMPHTAMPEPDFLSSDTNNKCNSGTVGSTGVYGMQARYL